MKSIRIIASIPELRPMGGRPVDTGAARIDPPAAVAPIPVPAPPPRPARTGGGRARFPVRSVVVLAVIATACWAAAGWSEWLRGRASPPQPPERLARESSAAGDRHGTITP